MESRGGWERESREEGELSRAKKGFLSLSRSLASSLSLLGALALSTLVLYARLHGPRGEEAESVGRGRSILVFFA